MDAKQKTYQAIRALGVIVKTPHIAAYLAQYDPKALQQAKAAFYAFETHELDAASSPHPIRKEEEASRV